MEETSHAKLAFRLTEGLRQAVHFLAVDVSLVPQKVVDQVGRGGEPLPEEASLYGHHQVYLHQVEGDDGVGEGHPQERLVARGPAAQVTESHVRARDPHFRLQGLGNMGIWIGQHSFKTELQHWHSRLFSVLQTAGKRLGCTLL